MQCNGLRWFTLLLVTMLPLAMAAQVQHGTDDGYTIRTTTHEVRIVFAANDERGNPVTNLSAADVAVADDGWIIRDFRSLQPSAESPLHLAILLDISESVAAQVPLAVASVQRLLLQMNWGVHDRISILTFGGARPELLCALHCIGIPAVVRLDGVRAGGETPLYDAMLAAARLMDQDNDPEARPAMVLFTDGLDTVSMHSLQDALLAAQRRQVAIYTVNTRPKGKSYAGKGDQILDLLAVNTGGLSFAPGTDSGAALSSVIDDLHGGYVLTYDPPGRSSGWHTVHVLPATNRQLRFRSRLAYEDGVN